MEISHSIDALIVIFYLAFCLFIGLYKAKGIKNLRQFAVGSKSAKAPLLTCVIFATVIGAGSTIGVVEKIYLLGLIFVTSQLLKPLYWLITAKIFGENIERFKGCLTISQVMHQLYGKTGRWITNILSMFLSAGAIAAQTTAVGHVFHYFFDIAVFQGIVISYLILAIYSTLGGIRSVIVTETFQFYIFFCVIPIAALVMVGLNLDAIIANAHALPKEHITFNFSIGDSFVWVGFVLYALLPDCRASVMQRYLMAENSKELTKSLKTIAFISIPFTAALCLVAYQLKILAPNINPADALLYFTNNLPFGIKGIMIAGLLAIAMSTAESCVNSSAVIMVNDMLKPLFPNISDSKQLLYVRICTLAISLSSILIAFMGKGILDIIWFFSSTWDSLMLIPIAAGFLGFKTNSRTLVVSSLMAALFIILGRLTMGEFGTASLVFGLAGSAIGFFASHYFQVYTGAIKGKMLSIKAIRITQKKPQLWTNIKKLVKSLKEHIKHDHIRDYAFCGITLYCYIFHFIMLSSTPATLALIILMVIGFMLCSLILMKEVFFSKKFIDKYFLPYFYLTITFCLPVVGSFMIFSSFGNDIWIINGTLFVCLVLFFLNAISSIIVMSAGTALGYATFLLAQRYFNADVVTSEPFFAAYVYVFLVVIALGFLRPQEKRQQEKLENMHMISGAIAHEVRSPIAALMMTAETMGDITRRLVAEGKFKNGHYALSLSQAEHDFLVTTSENVQKIGKKGLDTVDVMLSMMRNSVKDESKRTCVISKLVDTSLQDFIMDHGNAKDVEVNITNDFKVVCAPKTLRHVIINLLKNAYKHGGSGIKIKIYTKGNKLYFVDNGKGIAPEVLPHIFKRFYTHSKDGTGLGLAYCKMVMEALGGDITCKSKVGKYTKFILTFPSMRI